MLLNSPGDTCVIDFRDIVTWLCRELKKNDVDFDARDRKTCSDLVYTAFDNYFTENMIWTKRKMEFQPEHYLNLMPVSIDRHFSPYDLVEKLITKVAAQMAPIAEFPTWHYMEVQRHYATISITMGSDFRIDDWMEKHAKEYDVGKYKW